MTRKRRPLSTLWGLAVLAAGLGLYVYLVEVRGGERQERAQEAAVHLLPFPVEAATELVIERPQARIACRKEQGRWRITAPVRTEADDTTLGRVLEDIAQAKIDRTIPARPGELPAFGLDRPLLVTVAAGSQRQSIEVGKANPTGSFVFVRRAAPGGGSRGAGAAAKERSGPVLLVEQRLRDVTQKTLYDLRDKTVLEFDQEEVRAITLTAGGRKVHLARESPRPAAGASASAGAGPVKNVEPKETGPAGWRLVEPLRVRADRGMVERMLNLVSYTRAEEFVSEQPVHLPQYGLAPPWGSVRFDLKGGRSERLLLGRKTETGALTRYFARRAGPGPVFTVNDNLPQEAQRRPAEWRERHVTDFVRADVAELRLISPSRTVVCAKNEGPSGDEWRLAEFAGPVAEGMNLGAAARMPTALRADRDRVDGLLAHLATLEVAAFLDGASPKGPRFGLSHPQMKVVALDKAGNALASVSFGALSGARRSAVGSHLDGVFLVSESDVAKFRVASRDLAAR